MGQMEIIRRWPRRTRAIRQIQVVCEFNYSREEAIHAMLAHDKPFVNAGEFVDYLDGLNGVIKMSDVEHSCCALEDVLKR